MEEHNHQPLGEENERSETCGAATNHPVVKNDTFVPVLGRVRVYPSADWKLPFVKAISFCYNQRDINVKQCKAASRDGPKQPHLPRCPQVSGLSRSQCGTAALALEPGGEH